MKQLRSLFVLFVFCVLVSAQETSTAKETPAKTGQLELYATAKKFFLTNLTHIVFSINCPIPLEAVNTSTSASPTSSSASASPTSSSASTSPTSSSDSFPAPTSFPALPTSPSTLSTLLTPALISAAESCSNKLKQLLSLATCENITKSDMVYSPILRYRRYEPLSSYQPQSSKYQRYQQQYQHPSQVQYQQQAQYKQSQSHMYNKPQLVGYHARQIVEVCVPTTGAALFSRELVNNNASIFRVSSVVSPSYIDELRRTAVKEAVAKALQEADAALESIGTRRTGVKSIDISRIDVPEFTSIDGPFQASPRIVVSKKFVASTVRVIVTY